MLESILAVHVVLQSFEVVSVLSGQVYKQYPTNVKEFREAISYAIDYRTLL